MPPCCCADPACPVQPPYAAHSSLRPLHCSQTPTTSIRAVGACCCPSLQDAPCRPCQAWPHCRAASSAAGAAAPQCPSAGVAPHAGGRLGPAGLCSNALGHRGPGSPDCGGSGGCTPAECCRDPLGSLPGQAARLVQGRPCPKSAVLHVSEWLQGRTCCLCRRAILPTTMAAGAPHVASLHTAELQKSTQLVRAAAPACRSWPACQLRSRSASRAGWASPTCWICSTPSWPMSCGCSTQTRMRCLPETAWHCLVGELTLNGACFPQHSKLLAGTACLGGGQG